MPKVKKKKTEHYETITVDGHVIGQCVAAGGSGYHGDFHSIPKGDAAGLQPVLAKTVDIAISEANRNCDAEEAVSMLAEFFKSNKPESFQLVHHADKGETGFLLPN